MKILIVDDEEVSLSSVKRILKWHGVRNVEICDNGKEAIKKIRGGNFDVVLLDLLMPEVDGMQVLESTKPFCPQTEFIILTAVDDIPTTVKAMRQGAYDYLVKPVDNDLLFLSIERAYERKGLLAGLSINASCEAADIPPSFADTVTQSTQMQALISYAQVMARSGNPILITGESGTGKELMARGIHRAGPAPAGPFVAVNVSAIPATMFESQFFGHTKGAFTGADGNHAGFFEQADGGTLFLDEIGELPLGLQSKLLRVLEDKTFTPLGASRPLRVDVRLVSATNTELSRACQEGKFRIDLLYRLKSAHIRLPPLRERRNDIALLAAHFLQKANQRHRKNIAGFSSEALGLLMQKDYPGNIRELSQAVENAVLLADGPVISSANLGAQSPLDLPPSLACRHLCTLKENDAAQVMFVLDATGGNRREAARILGVTLRQLQRKLADLKKDLKI
ncbi:MAG: sigma-54-dependent Fis family transcriptional regulator [Deltaproteobacteria bacterium]|nr:sigma-54-dependent Fis family transcriptional regulator [Deltaproteobacteria bacterium]